MVDDRLISCRAWCAFYVALLWADEGHMVTLPFTKDAVPTVRLRVGFTGKFGFPCAP